MVVLKAIPVLLVQLVQPALLAQLVLKAIPVLKVIPVQPATKAKKVTPA